MTLEFTLLWNNIHTLWRQCPIVIFCTRQGGRNSANSSHTNPRTSTTRDANWAATLLVSFINTLPRIRRCDIMRVSVEFVRTRNPLFMRTRCRLYWSILNNCTRGRETGYPTAYYYYYYYYYTITFGSAIDHIIIVVYVMLGCCAHHETRHVFGQSRDKIINNSLSYCILFALLFTPARIASMDNTAHKAYTAIFISAGRVRLVIIMMSVAVMESINWFPNARNVLNRTRTLNKKHGRSLSSSHFKCSVNILTIHFGFLFLFSVHIPLPFRHCK